MASQADIVNLALAHIAEKANVVSISPPDDSRNAQLAARFYPIARDLLLSQYSWSFNTRRIALEELELGDDQPSAWVYSYGFPNDALEIDRIPLGAAVLNTLAQDNDVEGPVLGDDDARDFKVETLSTGNKVVYTNVKDACAICRMKIETPGRFSPGFVDALAWKLATYLVGPITKNVRVAQLVREGARASIADAKETDSNARKSNPYEHGTPAGVAARR